MSDNYDRLKIAVQDLLSELRITPNGLAAMAEGFSPSYPGKINVSPSGAELNLHDTDRMNTINISKVVAVKLMDAGVTHR